MGSNSKLVKWFGAVVKYVDSFSIEPDDFYQSQIEDKSNVDQPLQCSHPIPLTEDWLHPDMTLDHREKSNGNSTSVKRTLAMMQKDQQCSCTPIPQGDECLHTGVADQMGDGNSTSLKRTCGLTREDTQFCSTPILKTRLSHPGNLQNKKVDKKVTFSKSVLAMEESSGHSSCSTSETEDFLTDRNQMGSGTLIVQESVERCRTLVVPSDYFSESGLTDGDSQRETSTAKKITSSLKKRNLVADCGESSRKATTQLATPPASKRPSAVRTSSRMTSQRSSETSVARPKSSEKKTPDPVFGEMVKKTAERLENGTTLSETAARKVDEVLVKVFDTIATRAARLTAHRKKKTLTTDDVRMAVQMTLPAKMASTANRNASRVLSDV